MVQGKAAMAMATTTVSENGAKPQTGAICAAAMGVFQENFTLLDVKSFRIKIIFRTC